MRLGIFQQGTQEQLAAALSKAGILQGREVDDVLDLISEVVICGSGGIVLTFSPEVEVLVEGDKIVLSRSETTVLIV